MLASGCSRAGAADATPRLHVVRVNESSAEALAGVHDFAAVQVEACRAALHLGSGGAPALPDAQLGKIVFFQDEAFYDGDRIAHYKTRRFIVADSSSSCAPYVLVQREVKIVDGCSSRIVGRSGDDLNSVAPPAAPVWAPETRVENTGMPADACAPKRKPISTEGLQADVAGTGVACVWRSRLMAAKYGALMKSAPPSPGAGPSGTGLDECLYQPMPHYASAHSAGEDVVLRTHASEPSAQKRSAQMSLTGGHLQFEANTRLQAFEVGGQAAGKFDKAAVDAFVHLSPKEAP
jgi:hypothetical protein